MVTGYADGVDIGGIKDVDTGQVFAFKKSDIIGTTSAHGLVGTFVPYQSTDEQTIKLFPSSQISSSDDKLSPSAKDVRFRGYFTLNDAFAGFFANLIWGLHALVAITLIWVLFYKDIFDSVGAADFLDRLLIVFSLLIIYVAFIGVLTTFIAINEHLREINRRR